MKFQSFVQKVKYRIMIPNGLTRFPKGNDCVITDLFLLRSDENWQTQFEILNISALLNGGYSGRSHEKLLFVFYDSNGIEVGRKSLVTPKSGKHSLVLNNEFIHPIQNPATFAVFHLDNEINIDMKGSVLAERGYTGFQRQDVQMLGYVHGNFDAIAFSNGSIQMLGKASKLRRCYQIQHAFTGKARYELALVNPSDRTVKVEFQMRSPFTSWKAFKAFELNPRGSQIIPMNVDFEEYIFIRVVSTLHLGRPVIFRNSDNSFDVFHG